MSLDLVGQIMRQRIPDRTEKLILVAFAEHSNADGLTYPSVDLVAAEAQCSDRTVQRVVKRLLESGVLVLIREAHGRGNPHVYSVRPAALGPVPEYWQLRAAANAARLRQSDGLNERDDGNPQRTFLEENPKNADPADPLVSMGDKSDRMGDRSGQKGDITVSPEPVTFNQNRTGRAIKESPNGDPRGALDRPTGRSGSAGRQHRKTSSTENPWQTDVRKAGKTAHSYGLLPIQPGESELAFASRVDQERAYLQRLNRKCKALGIQRRRRDETFEQFGRRVEDSDLANNGTPIAADWRTAREQAIGRAGDARNG